MKSRVLMALAATLVLVSSNVAHAQLFEFADSIEQIGEMGNDISAANTTAKRVFGDIVMEKTQSKSDKEKEEMQQAMSQPRLWVTDLSYEHVDFENVRNGDGDIYATSLGAGWDSENISLGLIVPYDHLDFDGFDADRLGLVLFGQYHLALPMEVQASFTANLNYLRTFLAHNVDDINTYGGGVGVSVERDFDMFVPSVGISYQGAKQGSDFTDDNSHLIKVGGNLGTRLGDNFVLNIFAVGTLDVTDYSRLNPDGDYVDLGFDVSYSVSDTWSLTLGYKKVLALKNFDSDMVFLGSAFQF